MRIDPFIALCLASLAAQCAFAEDGPSPAPANVTVNLGALPVPIPRHKPTPEQMRAALLVPMPRPKPTPESLAALVPMPRPKPTIVVAEAAHKAKPPQIGTEAAPAHEGALTSPQSAAAIATELRGTTAPAAAPTPVNPIAGFSVVTRVRFRNGHSDLGDEAKASLDTLAARLLANEERVRLAAFSGQAGDTSSEARRLSLERALAVRTYLVSKGVPISRVDVLAFGGSTDGSSDRVDVLVRAI
jgi:outer membrane protein OmpA-like peptidoglycan-associated protein